MEAAGKGGGGQLRRLHIIYFLSRMGRTEHPHLIRVHHVNEKGVYLRDVKRWLSDLRGKGMPESFSWSYKRRYKTGYVWQDLMDDELITPISDNEYVLKGSEIMPSTPFEATSQGEKRAVEVEEKDPRNKPLPKEAIQENSSYFLPEIYQESPQFALDLETKLDDKSHQTQQGDKDEDPSSFYSAMQNQKNKRGAKTKDKSKDNNVDKVMDIPSCSSFSSPPFSPSLPYAKSKTYSSGARQKLRNLLSCGAVDTDDAVLIMLNRAGNIKPTHFDYSGDKSVKISKGDKLGGSARVIGTPWNEQQQFIAPRKSFDEAKDCKKKQRAEFGCSKVVSAAYKPVGGPTCS
ncbi:Protein SOSEKI - like 3 [Theobroma cacao]|nr:Protein SOSEKI - like 3 [Theobroma cacao]